MTSGRERRIESYSEFMEGSYHKTKMEIPVQTKLAAEMQEALAKVKGMSSQYGSDRWVDKVTVDDTNQRTR